MPFRSKSILCPLRIDGKKEKKKSTLCNKRIGGRHEKSGENFRPPPDGVFKGRYKVCRRLEIHRLLKRLVSILS